MRFFITINPALLVILSCYAALVIGAQNISYPHNQPIQRVPAVDPVAGSNALADSIRAEQNGTLRVLDMALLNSPTFTIGWNALFRQVRYNSTVPGDIRELSILRVAAIQASTYQWQQHEAVGRAEGLTSAQLKLIRDTSFSPLGAPQATSVFTAKQLAALKFADQSTKLSHISNDVWAEVAKQFPDARVQTELVLTVAAYSLVSRFLLAVSVDGVAEMQVPYPA